MPTVGEYNRALYNSLENAGIPKIDSAYAVLEAFKQQRGFGLGNTDLVPRIPGKINQTKIKQIVITTIKTSKEVLCI